jgi:hypothetical protein
MLGIAVGGGGGGGITNGFPAIGVIWDGSPVSVACGPRGGGADIVRGARVRERSGAKQNMSSINFSPPSQSMNNLPRDLVEVVAAHLEDDERVALYRCNRLMASAQGRARWTWRIHCRRLPAGRVMWLAIDNRFYTPLSDLPPSLTRLEILGNTVIDIEHIPQLPSLTDLSLSGCINEQIDHLHWAPNVTRLVMPCIWNAPQHSLACCIGDLNRLHTLDMGDAFDETLLSIPWPASLTSLRLGHSFREPLDGLPIMLRELVVGDAFNQSIDTTVWPDTLTSIELGNSFNCPLHNLPTHLTRLHVGRCFRTSCIGVVWPVSLVELSVPYTHYPGLPAFVRTSQILRPRSLPPHKQPIDRFNVLYKGKNRLLPVGLPFPLSLQAITHTHRALSSNMQPIPAQQPHTGLQGTSGHIAKACVIC